jgi:hypothetical protein
MYYWYSYKYLYIPVFAVYYNKKSHADDRIGTFIGASSFVDPSSRRLTQNLHQSSSQKMIIADPQIPHQRSSYNGTVRPVKISNAKYHTYKLSHKHNSLLLHSLQNNAEPSEQT